MIQSGQINHTGTERACAQPDVRHFMRTSVRGGVTAHQPDQIALIDDGRGFGHQRQGLDTGLAQGPQLTRIRPGVAVRIHPDREAGERCILRIDHTIMVDVQDPQSRKAIQCLGTIRHCRPATEEFAAIVNQTVAVAIEREPCIGCRQPANAFSSSIRIDIEHRTRNGRQGMNPIAIQIECDRGLAGMARFRVCRRLEGAKSARRTPQSAPLIRRQASDLTGRQHTHFIGRKCRHRVRPKTSNVVKRADVGRTNRNYIGRTDHSDLR